MFTRFRSERGATFVHVGIILLGLIAFSGFAVDQGVLVVGRRQAQNLADAGAHAGAVARAFDDTSDDPPADSGIVYESVVSTVQQGAVWGEPIPTSAIVMSYECPPGKPGRCVRTDVHRDGTNGSTALPTFFMKLVGTMSQPVRATATAHVAPANGTRCLKPWMLPDKFLDPDKNGYDPGDTYDAPGYTLSDIGTQLVLHPPGGQGVQPSDYQIINEIGGSEGSPEYEANIVNCQLTGWIGKVMMDVQGTKNGPTNQGVRALIDEDPTATWNGTTVTGPLGLLSPRVVIIGLFNPEVYWTEQQQGNGNTFEIVNLMAMFIERVQGGEVTARIVGKAGDMVGNAGSPPDNAEFLSMIEFVR
jgi:hypothetical protein